MRLGAGKHLVGGKQAIEAGTVDPLGLVHQLPPDHRDLRDRATPGEAAEAKEAEEDGEGAVHAAMLAASASVGKPEKRTARKLASRYPAATNGRPERANHLF